MTQSVATLEALLARARAGDQPSLGRLLELYRNYLRLLARSLIRPPLQVQLDASDLVQETFLKAHREFAQFAGSGERELVAWLRQILVRTLANQAKHHRARGATSAGRNRSTCCWTARAWRSRPTGRLDRLAEFHAARREQAVLLADALARLPADYREVFILRNLEHVAVDEIAARMGRSSERGAQAVGTGDGRPQTSDGGILLIVVRGQGSARTERSVFPGHLFAGCLSLRERIFLMNTPFRGAKDFTLRSAPCDWL